MASVIEDGTYLVKRNTIENYGAKWAYGYIVGVRGVKLRYRNVTERSLRRWAKRLESNKLGVWREGQYTYIDVWEHIDSLRTALVAADVFGQKAIFDLRESKVIYA